MILLIAQTFIVSVFLISTVGVFIPYHYTENVYPYYPFNSAWAFLQLFTGLPFLYMVLKALRTMREELQTWKQ